MLTFSLHVFLTVPEEPDNVVADVEPTPAVAPTPAPTPAPAPAPTPAPAPVLGMVATIIQNGRQVSNPRFVCRINDTLLTQGSRDRFAISLIIPFTLAALQ